MNLCVFQTKSEDEKFLAFEPVSVPIETDAHATIERGKDIVVQLTSRKRYKGIIIDLTTNVTGAKIVGTIMIKRK